MKRRKVVTRICAFTLTASLIAADPLPAFATELSDEPGADEIQAMEEIFTDEVITDNEGAEAENITEIMRRTESDPETETSDGLIYVDHMLYSGYYMDSAGIFHTVTEGVAKPFHGILKEGTGYFKCDNTGALTLMWLTGQTLFIEGIVYTGYCMDSAGIFYTVTEGVTKPFYGILEEGTEYCKCDDAGIITPMKLSGQTVFVEGKVYSGYYTDTTGKMYAATNGTQELKTGILDNGTQYYSFPEETMLTLSRQTLYVKGELYSGYYLDDKNRIYSVKKGALTLKTGILKKGTRYYSFSAQKTKKLSRETLYVKGKVYSGYYLNSKNKMYTVKKGTRTLKTGVVKKGTKYYNYKLKKTKKLSRETLYVKGKVYNGYYLNSKNKMYTVKKGTPALVTGMMSRGTRYYSYKSKKKETLSQETLYVEGKVYNGYYLDSDNKMYLLSNGTCTPVNTMLNAGTAYYSRNEKKMLTLPEAKVYVYGTPVEGLTPGGMATLQKAQAIVQTLSVPTDSKADKLYKCFLWMKKFPYVQYRTMNEAITNDPVDWDVVFANDIFDRHSGCCASESCAFAYMAKACGYEKVTICSDTEHAWVDIDGRLYDPLFAKDRDFSKNYNADYTDYRIHPVYTREL